MTRRKPLYQTQVIKHTAVCGHEVDLAKQSSMELCPECARAIPPLRDDQVGLSALALARLRKARRKSRARGVNPIPEKPAPAVSVRGAHTKKAPGRVSRGLFRI